MNRLLLALLLWPMARGVAQTVTTQPQPVQTTAPVIPAGTTLCTSPKNGGPCKVATPVTLKALSGTVQGQTYPVDLKGYSAPFSCQLPVKVVPMPQTDASGKVVGTMLVLVYTGSALPDAAGNLNLTDVSCKVVSK